MARRIARKLLLGMLLCGAGPLLAQSPAAPNPGGTTIVVVRHAEKADDDPRDPTLSPAGQQRALALRAALERAEVSAALVTQYRRTRLTAAPLAEALGAELVERRVAGDVAVFAGELAREILSRYAGRSVLVVGHSNTVPQIVQALSGQTVAPIAEHEYDQMFVVVVPASGPARLIRTRYGAPGS